MRPSDKLRQQNQKNWQLATDHAFCRELADGSLPEGKMRWYLAQDYKFVDHFVRLLATAIAHAPSIEDGAPGAQFLALVTSDENTYFRRSFEALGMTAAEIEAPAAQVTREFQSLMDQARHSGRYGRMLAVLVVAEWVYLSWGERYVGYDDALPFWFSEWIDLHSGPGFSGVVAYLRDQFDQQWAASDAAEQAEMARIFAQAVDCEADFFEAAYRAA